MRSTNNRLVAKATASVAIAALCCSGMFAAGAAQAATIPTATNVDGAAGWLAGQLVDGAIPSTWTPGTNDWGLTADVVFALTSRKVGATAAAAATDKLAANVDAYTETAGPGSRSAGATAKMLLVSVVQGRDATDFGGVDLPATLGALKATTGTNAGRFQDVGTGSDYSGSFSQSLAIIGLDRLSQLTPDAVGFLIGMQCPNGGFPYSPDEATGKCATNDDATTDTTAMALQALLSPGASGVSGGQAARDAAVAYLKGEQQPSGAFIDSPIWGGPNASSTGLVGSTLRAAGETAAADKAASWLGDLQLTCANAGQGKAATAVGAFTYDPAALNGALKDGIADADQPRRASAQAVLAFEGSDNFLTMSGAGATAAAATLKCAPTRTATVPASPQITTLGWSGNRKSVTVNFVANTVGVDRATSFAYRLKRTTGGAWGSWKSLAVSKRAFVIPNDRRVELIARNATGNSPTVARTAQIVSTGGTVAGCQALSKLTVGRRGTASLLGFAKRSNGCADWRFKKGAGSKMSGWKTLAKGATKLAVTPKSGAGGVLQVRTGKRVTTVYVNR